MKSTLNTGKEGFKNVNTVRKQWK